MMGDMENLQGIEDDSTDNPDSTLLTMPTTQTWEDNLLLPIPTTTPSFTRKIFLFEIRLTPDDIGQGRFFIPAEITLDKEFPLPPHKQTPEIWEKKINISDTQARVWPMTMRYNREECAFLIDTEWWLAFAMSNNLKGNNVICFFRPIGANNNHYLIEKLDKLWDEEETIDERFPAIFMREKFEFQWLVSRDDINFGSIILDEETVRRHFHAIRIPTRGSETPRHMERLYFTDAQNRDWCMKITYHLSGTYMIDWGEFVNENNVEVGDVIRFYRPPFQRFQPLTSRHFLIQHLKRHGDSDGTLLLTAPKQTKIFEFKWRNLLFQMWLTPTGVDKQGRLLIPVEIALDYFPRLFQRGDDNEERKKVIKITTDTCNLWWSTEIKYDHEECVFVIDDWLRFAKQNNFKAKNVIRFYKPFPRADCNSFLISAVTRRNPEENLEFREENFLFQKQLTLSEVEGACPPRLSLAEEQVITYFPIVGIPAETHKLERLYFTDARNKEWCCKIWCFFGPYFAEFDCECFFGTYFVENDWEAFVKEYKVENGDVIRFYKPAMPLDSRHFLIQHVNKIDESGGSSNLTHQWGAAAQHDGRSSDDDDGDYNNENEDEDNDDSRENAGIEGIGDNHNQGRENQQDGSEGCWRDSSGSRKKGKKKFGCGLYYCCFRARDSGSQETRNYILENLLVRLTWESVI